MNYFTKKNLLLNSCYLFTLLSVSSMASALPSEGKQVFDQWCQGCHMDSPFAPGTIFLKSEYNLAQPVIEKRTDLSAEFVLHLVRKGKGGMPSFRNTEITPTELTALVNYLTDKK